jgi:hypothetical protein
LIEDLPIHLLRWDMTAKPRVIHYIARLIADESWLGGSPKFIEDKTGKKRLSRH